MKKFPYPNHPEKSDIKVLKPTKEYKIEAIKVVASILLFAFAYAVLIITATGLAAIFSYLGIYLIVLRPSFFTLMIGLGLIGLGIMVLFFLIKFIFAIKKVDRSSFMEIHEKDFPNLYAFINRLAEETKAPKPKRIYLNPDVNASVFYDSSFLSMFFPAKKNLLIGLGLVNSVNMSEFKAVIAHEFGHFSQHSMTLGSYVFNVNKIIYNLLFENDSYADTINKWASVSRYFVFFAELTVKIVQVIQSVLQDVYVVVNKANLSLSRQMEHHADAVSAFVSGSNHLIYALKRIEISDYCFNILLNSYNNWLDENLKPVNIFEHHKEVLQRYASEKGFELENGLIKLNNVDSSFLNQSRIIIKDQWASHPDISKREEFLNSLKLDCTEIEYESPWILFENIVMLQKELTEKMYSTIKFNGDIVYLDNKGFKEKYEKENGNYTYNQVYRGYFNNRRVAEFDLNDLIFQTESKYKNLDEIITNENIAIPKQLNTVKSDIDFLRVLSTDQYKIKSFDFDGKKCSKTDIPELILMLEKEESSLQQKIIALDIEIFRFFIYKAKEKEKDFVIDLYNNFFKVYGETELALKDYNEIVATLTPVYDKDVLIPEAQEIIGKVKIIEKKIINGIKKILPEAIEQEYIKKSQITKMELYLSKEREYIYDYGILNSELEIFKDAMQLFLGIMFEREYRVIKILFDKQLEIFD